MKKKIIQTIKFLVFLCIGLSLLYLAAKGIDPKRVWTDITSANYFWIILSLVLAFFAHVSRAHRWRLLVEPLGYKPSLKNMFYSVMIGYLANYAFPRIGEVTRCGILNRTNKIPFDSLIGTVIIERSIDLIFSFIFLLVLLIGKFDFFGGFFSQYIFIPLGEKFSNIFYNTAFIVISIASLSIVVLLFIVFRKRLRRFTSIIKCKQILIGVGRGLTSIYKMKRRWEFLLYSIVIWILYLFMSYVIIFAFSFTSHLTLLDGVFILVAGTLGMIAPVQGGIGAFHVIVSLALGMYGIAREDGFSFATIQHGSQSLFAILLGAISLLLVYKSLKMHKVKETPEDE